MSAKALTLKKEERISSRTLIEKLFDGGNSRSMTAYPVRIVYLIESQPQEAAVKILPPLANAYIRVPENTPINSEE